MFMNADRRALKAGKYLSAFHQRKGGSMKKKNRKRQLLGLTLASVMALSALTATGCGSTSGSSGDENAFRWWIYSNDGVGTFYENYEENPAIEWINQQYWDTENGGIGTKENGTNLNFSFITPITGSEQDNFNTMMSTEEYPELIDMNLAGSAEALYDQGILLELTDYIDQYMPNYKKLLEENPDVQGKVVNFDEDGNPHYYYLAGISDGKREPWGGFMYRRDWLVKYATPTSHVWDWDSDYVKEHGHPAVTPLEEALAQNNLEGWKVNEVTSFTKDDGADVNNTYTDNVIFPSGKTDPYTVSDWEWMLEAFQKAIDDRSFADDNNAYSISVYYPGYLQTGDLVSSFGGSNASFYVNPEGEVTFSGTSDNFKNYLECLNTWYENGWLDTKFETRTSDMFFAINENGYSQGMVGMWYGGIGTVGDTIRVTCTDPEDQKDAYVMGCSVPVNDMYGTEDQKFKEPDCMYQDSRVLGGLGITNKAEGKNLEALFTFLDWCYSEEGGLVLSVGLTKDQIDSADIENNIWKENEVEASYTRTDNGDGTYIIDWILDPSAEISNATKANRLCGLYISGHPEDGHYTMNKGERKVTSDTKEQWITFTNTGSTMDYNARLTEEETDTYNKINNTINDYMAQTVPKLIKEGLSGWDDYVSKIDSYDPEPMCEIYQKYVDEVRSLENSAS